MKPSSSSTPGLPTSLATGWQARLVVVFDGARHNATVSLLSVEATPVLALNRALYVTSTSSGATLGSRTLRLFCW